MAQKRRKVKSKQQWKPNKKLDSTRADTADAGPGPAPPSPTPSSDSYEAPSSSNSSSQGSPKVTNASLDLFAGGERNGGERRILEAKGSKKPWRMDVGAYTDGHVMGLLTDEVNDGNGVTLGLGESDIGGPGTTLAEFGGEAFQTMLRNVEGSESMEASPGSVLQTKAQDIGSNEAVVEGPRKDNNTCFSCQRLRKETPSDSGIEASNGESGGNKWESNNNSTKIKFECRCMGISEVRTGTPTPTEEHSPHHALPISPPLDSKSVDPTVKLEGEKTQRRDEDLWEAFENLSPGELEQAHIILGYDLSQELAEQLSIGSSISEPGSLSDFTLPMLSGEQEEAQDSDTSPQNRDASQVDKEDPHHSQLSPTSSQGVLPPVSYSYLALHQPSNTSTPSTLLDSSNGVGLMGDSEDVWAYFNRQTFQSFGSEQSLNLNYQPAGQQAGQAFHAHDSSVAPLNPPAYQHQDYVLFPNESSHLQYSPSNANLFPPIPVNQLYQSYPQTTHLSTPATFNTLHNIHKPYPPTAMQSPAHWQQQRPGLPIAPWTHGPTLQEMSLQQIASASLALVDESEPINGVDLNESKTAMPLPMNDAQISSLDSSEEASKMQIPDIFSRRKYSERMPDLTLRSN